MGSLPQPSANWGDPPSTPTLGKGLQRSFPPLLLRTLGVSNHVGKLKLEKDDVNVKTGFTK